MAQANWWATQEPGSPACWSMKDDDLVQGAKRSTMDELGDATFAADKVLEF